MLTIIDLGNDTFEIIQGYRSQTINGNQLETLLANISSDVQIVYEDSSSLAMVG
jgi:hypothetical protein